MNVAPITTLYPIILIVGAILLVIVTILFINEKYKNTRGKSAKRANNIDAMMKNNNRGKRVSKVVDSLMDEDIRYTGLEKRPERKAI